MDYKKKLQNPLWQRKRLEILNRDNFTCQLCGCNNKELHVHHRWYEFGKNVWEYPDICFQTLCFECHEYTESNIKNTISDFSNIIRRTILEPEDYDCINNLLLSIDIKIGLCHSSLEISDAINYIANNGLIHEIIKKRNIYGKA